jgi:hypothetical protein
MRVSRRTIVIVLAAVAVLLVIGVAMRGHVSDWHARLRDAIHGQR